MQLTIEKLVYGGEGLAHLPANESGSGKAVFVPFVLTGEKVKASIIEEKPGFARARAEAVIELSPIRIQPGCPYFGQCGGCHYQHTSYEHQIQIKQEILRETLRRTAKLELPVEIQIHPSPPWNYRNRSRLQIQTHPSFAVGYFKAGSHELLPVETCPISSPLINQGISVLSESGRSGKVPAGIREVEFFANAEDSQMLIEISCSPESRRAEVRAWMEDLRIPFPEISGAVAVRRSQASKCPEQWLSVCANSLEYRTQRATYHVSAGSFFQTNRFLIDKLVQIVTEGQSGKLVLDLYAGVGLFSTALTGFKRVISVESSQTSTGDLSYNLASNGEAVQATTEQYLARAENSGRVRKGTVLPHIVHKPDLAVVDPPRVGLGERVARMLARLGAPRIVYVSCDPATLARDLKILVESGYRIEQLHLVDLFPQTYHLETVVHLVR